MQASACCWPAARAKLRLLHRLPTRLHLLTQWLHRPAPPPPTTPLRLLVVMQPLPLATLLLLKPLPLAMLPLLRLNPLLLTLLQPKPPSSLRGSHRDPP